MDFANYNLSTPHPSRSEILVIAFGKVGKELREFPVATFYECFTGAAELAADPDFNAFKLLRSGMSDNEIQCVLRENGFRTFLGAKAVDNSKEVAAYKQELTANLERFKRDLSVELEISDLPTKYLDEVFEDACKIHLDGPLSASVLENIYRTVQKQVKKSWELIREIRDVRSKLAQTQQPAHA